MAKVVERPAFTGDPTESPTITLTATHAGMIMGTAAYMSPEQAAGKPVDKRSDVWSFGVVLWEMLTGTRLFQGESVAHTLADVLRADIEFDKLPEDTPQPIRELLTRCLDRDTKTRLRDLGEARVLLQKYLADPSKVTWSGGTRRPASTPANPPPAAPRSRAKYWLALGTATVVGAVAASGYLFYSNQTRTVPGPERWKQITNYPDGVSFPAVSADGRMLAFLRERQLYVKILPDGPPVQLTHDGLSKADPAFSPDGSRIVYTAIGTFDAWVVPVLAGGEPRLILPNAAGVTWIDSLRILFSEEGSTGISLETAMENRTAEREIYRPSQGAVQVAAISPNKKEVLVVEASPDGGHSSPCRLLPFDGSSPGREVGSARCAAAAWTPDGKWMYFAGESSDGSGKGSHIWRQRTGGGKPEQVTFGPAEQQNLAMAPDGKSIYTAVGSTQSGLWIHDPKGDRQLSSEGSSSRPVFDPDGKRRVLLISRRPARAARCGPRISRLAPRARYFRM